MVKLIKLLMLLIVIAFIAILAVWGFLPSIISGKLTKMAGVPVSLSSFQVRPSSILIERFIIDNPPKSLLSQALVVDEIEIRAPLMGYFKENIVIDEVDLDTVALSIEMDKKGGKVTNWKYIMAHLNKNKASETSSSTNVLIRRLLLKNVSVKVAYKDTGKVEQLKPIKRIELNNISSQGGIPSAQIMHIIIEQSIRNIFSTEGLQNLLEDMIKPDSGFFKSLFSEAAVQ